MELLWSLVGFLIETQHAICMVQDQLLWIFIASSPQGTLTFHSDFKFLCAFAYLGWNFWYRTYYLEYVVYCTLSNWMQNAVNLKDLWEPKYLYFLIFISMWHFVPHLPVGKCNLQNTKYWMTAYIPATSSVEIRLYNPEIFLWLTMPLSNVFYWLIWNCMIHDWSTETIDFKPWHSPGIERR